MSVFWGLGVLCWDLIVYLGFQLALNTVRHISARIKAFFCKQVRSGRSDIRHISSTEFFKLGNA